jgi:hypothetical protein
MPSKAEYQHNMDQVPTITDKSSGIEYLRSQMEPRQDSRVEKREKATENDKA